MQSQVAGCDRSLKEIEIYNKTKCSNQDWTTSGAFSAVAYIFGCVSMVRMIIINQKIKIFEFDWLNQFRQNVRRFVQRTLFKPVNCLHEQIYTMNKIQIETEKYTENIIVNKLLSSFCLVNGANIFFIWIQHRFLNDLKRFRADK